MQTATANTNSLHEEHQQWLNDLAFWHNELFFYARVFVGLAGDQNLSQENIEEMEKLKSRIDNLNNQLTETKAKVEQHDLSEGAGSNGQGANHEALKADIKKFEQTFRELKNDVFVFTDREDN